MRFRSFRTTFRCSRSSGAEATRALRESLLPRTLEHAAGLPAYRRLYAGVPVESVRRVSDLRRLPLLSKELVMGRESEFVDRSQTPTHVQFTSGTTGESLVLTRSAEESAAIRRLLARPVKRPMPLALLVQEHHHGTPTGIPGSVFVLTASLASDRSLEQALALLQRTFALRDVEPRVSVVGGTETGVRALTHYAERRSLDVGSLGVEAVHTYGNFVPQPVREWLEDAWAAPLVDRYSCAEHFGGASSLPGQNLYRFDPYVIPEVVDPDSGDHVYEGLGELVLTSLAPLVQAMPLVRYRTGDLVEIVKADREFTELHVRLKGRRTEAVRHPIDDEIVLLGADLRDALETVPGIVFETRRRDLSEPGLARRIGHPVARVRIDGADGDPARLTLTLRVAGRSASASATACDTARAELLRRSAALAEAVAANRVRLTIRAE